MCRNCAGFDDEHQDVWAAALAHRDGKAPPQPKQNALLDREPAPVLPPRKAAR